MRLAHGWSVGHAALTLGCLGLLGWTLVSLGEVSSALRATAAIWTQPVLLAVFVGGYTAAFGLRAAAWSVLLGGTSNVGVVRLFGFLQVALLANHVFPTKVGEVVRVALLARAGTPLPHALGSTIVARLMDLGALCVLATLGLAIGGVASWIVLPLLVTLAGGGVVIAIAAGSARGLVARLPGRLARAAAELEAALGGMSSRQLVLALACTLPSWALEALALWTVARAAGTDVSLAVAVSATAFTIAFQGFQVTPGGIGLYEASLTAALGVYGIDPATGLGLALATHALKFAFSFAAGLLAAVAEVVPPLERGRLARRIDVAAAGFALALFFALLSGRTMADYAIGSLVVLPLLVASKCHHLPRALWPLLLTPVVVFAIVFGVQSPILAGADRPAEVTVFGVLTLLGLVFARQWWLARRPLPPPTPLPSGSLIAVVIPVLNEAPTIGDIVAAIPRANLASRGFGTCVVIVDDGSTDASAALALQAGADRVVSHAARAGLGAALRTGLAAARSDGADAVVYVDGDGEYDPRDLPSVVEPVLSGEADYVLGVRFPAASGCMHRPRRIGNRLLTLLQCLLTGRALHDGQTGFRALGPRALTAAEIIHDYNYAQVLTLDLLRKRLRLAEVPISYQLRRSGRSFIRYHEYALRVLPAIAREVLTP